MLTDSSVERFQNISCSLLGFRLTIRLARSTCSLIVSGSITSNDHALRFNMLRQTKDSTSDIFCFGSRIIRRSRIDIDAQHLTDKLGDLLACIRELFLDRLVIRSTLIGVSLCKEILDVGSCFPKSTFNGFTDLRILEPIPEFLQKRIVKEFPHVALLTKGLTRSFVHLLQSIGLTKSEAIPGIILRFTPCLIYDTAIITLRSWA